MRPPICTIDASAVIALDHLDLIPQLSLLFSRVLLPRAVRSELFRRRSTKDRLRHILRTYAFIEACDRYDKVAADILLIERVVQAMEDRGETETVVQASEVGAVVIVDDPWGRLLAQRFNLSFHGTIWVLRRFFELGVASGGTTRSWFVALLRRGIRLPLPSINQFLSEIGQQTVSSLDLD